MRTTRHRTAARRVADDAGFGLLETVVAMLVLSVVSLAVLSMLATAQRTAYGNRARVVAANLAASEMDYVRTQARDGISALDPGVARTSTTDVAGTTYTVDTEIVYVDPTDPDTSCGVPVGVQMLDGVRVNVQVTWPSMGGVQPVTSDSMISPAFADINATTGTIVVRVIDRAGDPLAGVTAAVPTKSALTSAEGCAILTEVPTGTPEVTISKSGHVDTGGNDVVSRTLTVVGGSVTNVEALLDKPATLVLTGPGDAANYPVPTTTDGFKLLVSSTEAGGGGRTATRAGASDADSSTTFDTLFPFSGGYAVHAGPCAVFGASGNVRTAATEPGDTVSVAVPYRQVEVRAYRKEYLEETVVEYIAEDRDGCPGVRYARGSESEPATVGHTQEARIRASLPTGTFTVRVHYGFLDDSGMLQTGSAEVSGVEIDAGVDGAVDGVQVVEVTLP